MFHGDQTTLEENITGLTNDHAARPGQKFLWLECWRAICLR